MKAIAVKPGIPNTVHLTELPAPQVGDIPERPRRAGARPYGLVWMVPTGNQCCRVWPGASGIRLPGHRS
jgi:hypothetical protein